MSIFDILFLITIFLSIVARFYKKILDDVLMLFYSNSFYYGGEKFFLILGDAGGSDQIQKSQLAGLKVQRIVRGWLARKLLLRLRLREATTLIRGFPEAISMTGLPQWQSWSVVHSANGSKDYSGALSTVYVSRYDNKNVGRLNIVDLATHMAKYQSVLTELQVRVKKLKVQRIVRGWLARRQLRCLRLLQVTAPYLNTAPGTTKNACGSGKSGESQSILSHLRGGGSETQDGK